MKSIKAPDKGDSSSGENTNPSSFNLKACQEAMILETTILNLVIGRNSKQHAKAQYYRRLKMVLVALKRYPVMVGFKVALSSIDSATGHELTQTDSSTKMADENKNSADPGGGLVDIISYLDSQYNHYVSLIERYRGMQKQNQRSIYQQEEECWTLDTKSTSKKKNNTTSCSGSIHGNNSSISSSEKQKQFHPFLHTISTLHALLQSQLPEILSRILHASDALYKEISRGYFLPICSVSVACIARIRSFIMHLGLQGCIIYKKVTAWLRTEFGLENDNSNITSTTTLQKDGTLERMLGLSTVEVNEFFHSGFNHTNHTNHTNGANGTNKPKVGDEPTSTETNIGWSLPDDVLNQYIEMTENDHNKLMTKKNRELLYQRVLGRPEQKKMDDSSSKLLAEGHSKDKLSTKEMDNNNGADGMVEEEIGECIQAQNISNQSHSSMDLTSSNKLKEEEEDDEKDSGDRNHELTKLFQQQKKRDKMNGSDEQRPTQATSSVKKKRKHEHDMSPLVSNRMISDNDNKEGMQLKGITDDDNNVSTPIVEEKSKTKKSKKDKMKKDKKRRKSSSKKKKKDFFDDIFDSL